MDQGVIDYIRDALVKGYRPSDIRSVLRGAGWKDADIDAAFAEAGQTATPQPSADLSAVPAAWAGGLTPIPDLFKRAFEWYRDRFWTYIGVYIGYIILLIPVLFVVGMAVVAAGVAGVAKGKEALAGILVAAAIGGLIVMAVVILIAAWWQAAAIVAIRDRKERVTVIDAFRRAMPAIPRVAVAVILQTLAVLGGFMLLIIPGIIFAIWFSLTVYVVVVEGVSAGAALSRSKQLVTDNWWDVFLRFLAMGLVFFVAYMLPFGLLMAMGAVAGEAAGFVFALLSNVVQTIVGILLTPYLIIYSYLVYLDLRRLKG